MEPKFQTSFIPKTPITTSSSITRTPVSFTIVGILGTLLFTLALILSGLGFGYEYYLNKSITQATVSIAQSRSAFESEDNQSIIDISDQLASARVLLNGHIVVSPLFDLLQNTALPTITFTGLVFDRSNLKTVGISISGESQNYSSIAEQAHILSETKYFKNISFSDMSLTDAGKVTFKYRAEVEPALVSYGSFIQGLSVGTHTPIRSLITP
jgi:hypothetical protein